jgi:hypothetical protein
MTNDIPSRVSTLLPVRTVNWVQTLKDAQPNITTPYTYLVHNDGYALDDFYLCELVQGLKDRKDKDPSAGWAISAPMLYESKYDGSLVRCSLFTMDSAVVGLASLH